MSVSDTFVSNTDRRARGDCPAVLEAMGLSGTVVLTMPVRTIEPFTGLVVTVVLWVVATTVALARFKWNRIYALPFLRAFHTEVASYFIKDDHDTLKDDCWPGQNYGALTWADGLALVRDLLKLLDGSIAVSSEVGVGTSFTFRVPVQPLG